MAVRLARTGGIALAVLACLAAAACGGGSDESGKSGGKPSAASGACPAPVVKRVTERPAPEPAVTIAARYLAARESWLSACRPSTTSWEAQGKKLMTAKGWRTHPRDHVNTGQVHGQMKTNGWNVRVIVSCGTNPEMGPSRPASQPLFCSLADTTVDASGKPVPIGKLPAKWPFTGEQNPAPMLMKKQAGTWLVAQDATGLAQ